MIFLTFSGLGEEEIVLFFLCIYFFFVFLFCFLKVLENKPKYRVLDTCNGKRCREWSILVLWKLPLFTCI